MSEPSGDGGILRRILREYRQEVVALGVITSILAGDTVNTERSNNVVEAEAGEIAENVASDVTDGIVEDIGPEILTRLNAFATQTDVDRAARWDSINALLRIERENRGILQENQALLVAILESVRTP